MLNFNIFLGENRKKNCQAFFFYIFYFSDSDFYGICLLIWFDYSALVARPLTPNIVNYIKKQQYFIQH